MKRREAGRPPAPRDQAEALRRLRGILLPEVQAVGAVRRLAGMLGEDRGQMLLYLLHHAPPSVVRGVGETWVSEEWELVEEEG